VHPLPIPTLIDLPFPYLMASSKPERPLLPNPPPPPNNPPAPTGMIGREYFNCFMMTRQLFSLITVGAVPLRLFTCLRATVRFLSLAAVPPLASFHLPLYHCQVPFTCLCTTARFFHLPLYHDRGSYRLSLYYWKVSFTHSVPLPSSFHLQLSHYQVYLCANASHGQVPFTCRHTTSTFLSPATVP
jgi:hypothetical protein